MRRDRALVAVAAALMSDADARHYGYPLSRRAGIRSALMYPVLRQMLDDGWLEDGWEDQPAARRQRRPPRRYYTLTAAGKGQMETLLAREQPTQQTAARSRRRWGLPAARQVPRA
jgi:PadR family transcriptional regulator PadR